MDIENEQLLQVGIEAHKAGDMLVAERLYRSMLKTNPNHPDANHNLALIILDTEQPDTALPHFKAAVDTNPMQPQFWVSYMNALIKLGSFDKAFKAMKEAKDAKIISDEIGKFENWLVRLAANNLPQEEQSQASHHYIKHLSSLYNRGKYQKVLDRSKVLCALFPNNPFIQQILGATYAKLGADVTAISSFSQAITLKPDALTAHNSIAEIFFKLGRFDDVITKYEEIIGIKPDSPDTYNNLGITFGKKGFNYKAIEAYQMAIIQDPTYSIAYYNMSNSFNDIEQIESALEICKRAAALNSKSAEIRNNLGVYLQTIENLDEAITAYKEAIEIQKDYEPAYVNLASVYEQSNNIALLKTLLEQAEKIFPSGKPNLQYFWAKFFFRQKKYFHSKNILENIKIDELSHMLKIGYLETFAKCLDENREYSRAFEKFIAMNRSIIKLNSYNKKDAKRYFSKISHELDQLRTTEYQGYTSSIDDSISPTFLIGFPRSGTTLLDSILRGHSKIDVVEEKPMVEAAKRTLNSPHDISFIENLSPSQLQTLRNAYLLELSKYTKIEHQVCTIDKFPLNILNLPLIYQAFPKAKYLLAIRHPLDVILSCFMQNFKINPQMANMVSLDQITQFYCIAMQQLTLCEKRYSLSLHIIRYEDLITSFQTTTNSILEYLDLEWETKLADHGSTAKARAIINTPSYSQVVQPLYKTAIYRWKNYRDFFEDYYANVEPWIKKFGYNL